MIKKKEVKHIAKLTRISLSQKEIEKLQRELSLILDYIEKLKEVDISKVEPTIYSLKIENIMREDKINEKLKIKNEKLLELAPETKKGYLKVKKII